ncbi:MAG: tyrosine-type recombinase/integrase [Phyllobacteriaceae bacterium]|nr:tyrosine-type recombinase/integrase [Phyllobacteriaceae bacterium]
MRRKLPPFVETWNDRHGKRRFYFRRGKGRRVALPADVGSPEFDEAYRKALTGEIEPKPMRKGPAAPGSIAALIVSYRLSAAYIGLRATTKKGYATRIAVLEEKHGHRSVRGLTRERIMAGILQPYAEKPGAALSLLKMLRILIRHAIDLGWLDRDPSLGIKRPKTQEIRSWTDEEISAFEARWPIGTKQRLAFALHLYTGQRRSDVHRMTWADYTAGTIRVVQQKTKHKLLIPVHPALAKALAAAPREHVTILNTAFGKPFTVAGFSQFMRSAITDAGLPLDCQPHGLRKAAGRRLAEAGCSAHEIMSILGHKTLSEAERYTRDADQLRLARAAMAKMTGQNANDIPQPVSPEFGNSAEKPNKFKVASGKVALPTGLEPVFSP